MKYPAYPSLQRIDRAPLTHLPGHWGLRRLRFLAGRIEQGWSPQCENLPADDDAWGVMKVGCVNGSGFDWGENKALPIDLEPLIEFELRPGDVLVSRANTRELVGSAALVPNDVRAKLLLCDKLFRLNPLTEVNPRYLVYWLRTPAARFHYERDATGASGSMQNIGQDTLKDVLVPLPPVDEQEHIANFLDWKTGQIDLLVSKRRHLVEKLRERRLAVTFRLATLGLRADAPLRESEIPWAPRIPSHWRAGNIRRFAAMKTGHTPKRSEAIYWDACDIPWFTLADVWQLRDGTRVYLGETKEKISALGLQNSAAEVLPKGTVVFSRTASVGFSGIMPIPMATSQDFWNWIPDEGLLSEYLLVLFRAMEQEFKRLTMGSTHKTIYQPDAASLRICVPPPEEQRDIVDALLPFWKRMDGLIKKAVDSVEKLTGYRSALITAAVTGQIDVRSVAVPAPA